MQRRLTGIGFNHHRLYEYCGDIPPIELEAAYYAQQRRPAAG
jgi:putative transposase